MRNKLNKRFNEKWIDGKFVASDMDNYTDDMCDLLNVTTWEQRNAPNKTLLTFTKKGRGHKYIISAVFDKDENFMWGGCGDENDPSTVAETKSLDIHMKNVKNLLSGKVKESKNMKRKSRTLRESAGNAIGNLEYTSLIPQKYLASINKYFDNCKKIANYLETHSYLLEYTDAKLHDVFWKFDNVDDFFLTIEWENFEEYCKDIDVTIENRRGSSSKFYLNDDDGFLKNVRDLAGTDRWGNYKIDWLDIADAVDYTYYNGTFDASLFETESILNDYLMNEVFEYYDHDTMEDIAKAVADIIETESTFNIVELVPESGKLIDVLKKGPEKAHDYLNEFKKNQVQIYQDYLNDNE